MTTNFRELYTVLNLEPGARWRDLKAAYRSQIRVWHPDRVRGDAPAKAQAEERTKAINNAYATLVQYYENHGRLPLDPPPIPLSTATENTHDPRWQPSYPPTKTSGVLFGIGKRFVRDKGTTVIFVCLAIIVYILISTSLSVEIPPPESSAGTSTFSASDVPTSVSPRDRHATFTIGSSIGEVYAAQGVPTRTEKDIWFYDNSKIYFVQGMVVSWEEAPGQRLNVRSSPEPSAVAPATFKLGSTKAEVRRIQGEPVREASNVWDYGVSRVYFHNDRVSGWHESTFDPLKVKR